jgi:hypothetical protein
MNISIAFENIPLSSKKLRSVESLKASLVDSRSCLQVSNDHQICRSKLC